MSIFVQNASLEEYANIYVDNNEDVKLNDSSTTIGQRVINAALEKYGEPQQIGCAKMQVTQPEEKEDAIVTINTRDFTQTGRITYDGGILVWDDLEQANEEIDEPIDVETNPDYFTYSSVDADGNVSITGLSTGEGGGEEAYNNNDENVLNLVIPKKNKDGNSINKISNNAFKARNKIKKLVIGNNIVNLGAHCFANCTSITDLTVPIVMKTRRRKWIWIFIYRMYWNIKSKNNNWKKYRSKLYKLGLL